MISLKGEVAARLAERDDSGRQPPLSKVIGSKGKGGWFGKKSGKDTAKDKKTKGAF